MYTYDLQIPHLGLFSRKKCAHVFPERSCIRIFIAALLLIVPGVDELCIFTQQTTTQQ